MPIDGTLDLHTFSPGDISSLIPEYLNECRNADIMEVRIVHGKGMGILRKSVHAILKRMDMVESYALAPAHRGHWGATIVKLRKKK